MTTAHDDRAVGGADPHLRHKMARGRAEHFAALRRGPGCWPERERGDAMMGAFVSKWPVLEEHQVGADDLDADGVVRDASVARWVAAARSAYLSRCTVLRQALERSGLELRELSARLPPGAALGRAEAVAVTAGVTEVRPASFTIAVRLRTSGADRDVAVNASCVMHLVDPTTGAEHEIGDEIRDEFIALEHSASHYN